MVLKTSIFAMAFVFVGCSSAKEKSSGEAPAPSKPSMPSADTMGSCLYEGSILSSPLKYKGATPAPASYGDQCNTHVSNGACLDAASFTDGVWVSGGCPESYVAKCDMDHYGWYLYIGPSTKVVQGGAQAQKEAFVTSCETEGKVPELR